MRQESGRPTPQVEVAAAPNELVLQDATRHGLIHFVRDGEDWVGAGPDRQDYVITRDRPKKR